jgi:hypothetical protein
MGARMSGADRVRTSVGFGLLAVLAIAAGTDRALGWFEPAFDAVAHLFYEIPVLAAVRRPTQIPLARAHLAVWTALITGGLIASFRLSPHARTWWAVFCLAYAVRAAFWIAGGNLPLVPGDSCHYLEVATSIYRGEGPVKHYVESFFIDYAPIRQGRGVLDDWATPLYSYVLAAAYRLTGVVPGQSLEATVAVAKGTSFILNLLCLPALYVFARRRFGSAVALGAMAVLAVLPVHALYAGFVLRESLVALTSIVAIGTLTEVWNANGRASWGWAIAAGVWAGAAILARNTALALIAVGGVYGLVVHGRKRLGPLLLWGFVMAAMVAPWAWVTMQAYGEPFYTYTKYFQYNFSWTVHHYDRGITRAGDFYTAANAPTIIRVKIKSLLMIAVYSTMIVGLPLVLGYAHRLWRPREREGVGARDVDRLVAALAAGFVVATLANIADVTQVAQLGRYYLPIYVLAIPTAVAGIGNWLSTRSIPKAAWPPLAATFMAVVWADPTWAYDSSWLVKPYQLHLPALRATGDWIRDHPEDVPREARIMTWFPWELRVVSDRTTVLLPRSLEGGPYEVKRVTATIELYGVTHVLWGSFEPSPHADPESLGPYLTELRRALGLTENREVYRSPPGMRFPVRLYRLRGSAR